jgi:hypothetical protein
LPLKEFLVISLPIEEGSLSSLFAISLLDNPDDFQTAI